LLDDTGGPDQASAGGPLQDYIDFGGALLLAVVLTGDTPVTLHNVRIGTLPPAAHLSATPPGGLLPLDVAFDAADSLDPDGSIVKYEWDLDGDGVFELDSGAVSSAQHSYAAAGDVTVSLRVTDDVGAAATDSIVVPAFTEWNHTWGKSFGDYFTSVLVSGTTIFAGGNINVSGNNDITLQAFSMDGQSLWRKQWNNEDDDFLYDLALSPDRSTIYAVGSSSAGGAGQGDWLVQAWSTDGTLLWTRLLGGAGADTANSVVIAGGDLFVCGSGRIEDAADLQATIVRFSLSGEVIWQRAWGGASSETCDSACLIPVILGTSSIGMLGYTSSYGAGLQDLLFLKFSLEGDLLGAMTWGDAGTQLPGDICSSFGGNTYARQ
jgi:hypothetical protein